MDDIARLSKSDRSELFSTASSMRGDMLPALVEKDFWVCWALKRIFTLNNPPAGLIFNMFVPVVGTSYRQVYSLLL